MEKTIIMEVEIRAKEPLVHNEFSLQSWIPLKEYVPTQFSTENVKGDYAGRYLCIVERVMEDNNLFRPENKYSNQISRTIEMCYWNNLSNRFQDKDSEWVSVIYWSPLSKFPIHKFESISRPEILQKIETGELELIAHENAKRSANIPSIWEITKSFSALYNTSFNDVVFFSTAIVDGFEDCIWAKKKSVFPKEFIPEAKSPVVEDLRFGQTVYHEDLYWGREPMKVVGIRETEVELEGDYSGGTNAVCQKSWMPVKGLYLKKQ